jgi:hypothetical protein
MTRFQGQGVMLPMRTDVKRERNMEKLVALYTLGAAVIGTAISAFLNSGA